MEFLKSKRSVTAFTWTTPDGEEIKVICKEWSKEFIAKDVAIVSATFIQVFE